MVLALFERPLTLTLSPEGRGDDGGACGARFELEPLTRLALCAIQPCRALLAEIAPLERFPGVHKPLPQGERGSKEQING